MESTDPLGAKARYGYDALGRIDRVEDPNGNATAYRYDGLGNLLKTDSPDAGVTEQEYDAAGNVVSRRDARGIQTRYGFDAKNRLTDIDYPSDADVHCTYDEGQNALGRLSRITDASGTTRWQYDSHGRIVRKTQTQDGVGLALAYGYDAAGRLAEVTYPSGAKVLYRYEAERIVGLDFVPPAGATQNLLDQIRYDAQGQAAGWTWGNGQSYSRQLDQDGRVQSYPLGEGTRTLNYDAAGQISDYRNSGNPVTGLAHQVNQDQSFAYDLAGRLQEAANPGWQLAYGLDANGNRTDQHVTELEIGTTQTTQYRYTTGSNTLEAVETTEGATPYQVDAAGNLTHDDKHRYAYNDAGRLSGTENTGYRYNGLGQRVSKTVHGNTTRFVYDEQGKLLGEYDNTGKAIQETVYLNDTPVAVSTQQEILYIHADHLNAPRLMVDRQNRIAWVWDSDPFGNAWNQNSQAAAHGRIAYHLRFPGQYYDPETGLYYNYFRDYDPRSGRYVEVDPIGLEGGLNPYLYANANPLTYSDPTGESAIAEGIKLGGRIGGSVGTAIEPGVGTLIGAGVGSAIGAGIGYAILQCTDDSKPCPPCKLADGTVVPLGTIAYRWDKLPPTTKQHGIYGDHLNLYKANQNPNNCQCFWQYVDTVPPPPQPSWIPIQPFAN